MKKLNPHLSKYWKIPPEGNVAFVAAMEDVLEVYRLPYDPDYPVVCMDESSKQLIGEVHTPIPCTPGQPKRMDGEMDNLSTHSAASLHEAFEPQEARRLAQYGGDRAEHAKRPMPESADTRYGSHAG